MQAEDQPADLKKDQVNPENGTAKPAQDKPKRKRNNNKNADGEKEKPQTAAAKYRVKGDAPEAAKENGEASGNKISADEGAPRPETAKDGEKKKRQRNKKKDGDAKPKDNNAEETSKDAPKYRVKGAAGEENGDDAENNEEKKGDNKNSKKEKDAKKDKEEKNLVYQSPFDFKDKRQYKNKWEEYRFGQWRKEQRKTYVTLETVIPELPEKKIEAPDEAAFHKKQVEMDNKIKDLYKDVDELKGKFSGFLEQKQASNQGKTPIANGGNGNKISRLKQLNTQKDKIHREANKYDDEKLDLTRKLENCRKKIEGKYNTSELVAKGIKDLKKQFESSSGTSREESNYLSKKKKLEESIKFIEDKEVVEAALNKINSTIKDIKKPLKGIYDEVKQLQNEVDEERKDREIKTENIDNLNKQLDRVSEKRKKDFDEIDKMRKQKQELQDKYYGQMIDYTKYQYLVNDIKWMNEVQERLKKQDEVRK